MENSISTGARFEETTAQTEIQVIAIRFVFFTGIMPCASKIISITVLPPNDTREQLSATVRIAPLHE